MEVNLKLVEKMKILGTTPKGHKTYFDSLEKVGGDDSAPTPMEVMLQAMGACSFMDVISILRKKRKEVIDLEIKLNGERAEEHPKVFTKAHLSYILTSPDTDIKDLERAIELSQEKYCGASAVFKRSGCEVTYDAKIIKP